MDYIDFREIEKKFRGLKAVQDAAKDMVRILTEEAHLQCFRDYLSKCGDDLYALVPHSDGGPLEAEGAEDQRKRDRVFLASINDHVNTDRLQINHAYSILSEKEDEALWKYMVLFYYERPDLIEDALISVKADLAAGRPKDKKATGTDQGQTKERTLKRRGHGKLNEQVANLRKSSHDISAPEIAKTLNTNYVGVYRPTTEAAVRKTENWKTRHKKKKNLKKK